MSIRGLIPWHRKGHSHVPSTLAETHRNPLQSLHNELDRTFDDVFQLSTLGQQWFGSGADIWPKIDITDDEREVKIIADMPGMEQNDINVSIEDGILTLKGEKLSESENKETHFSERFYGQFERRIPVGYELDDDKIDAHFANGVLKITLPKSENAKSKMKPIKIRT